MIKLCTLSLLLLLHITYCFAQKTSVNTLFFSPTRTDRMWDTWMYYTNNTFYLYYLITKNSPGEGIGLATSRDGIHWMEKGRIWSKSDSALWIGTGSVWEGNSDHVKGRYVMNFSEWYGGPGFWQGQQYIFFAVSNDLIHWTKANEVFKPDTSFYKMNQNGGSRWDCIYTIPRKGGGRYGYWTANPKAFDRGFGFGQTRDGLHWQALPPPVIQWGNRDKFGIEVGAVQYINGRYYMMAGGRYQKHLGMFTLESDRPNGPFYPSQKNFSLLTSPEDLWFTYFARFFLYKGKILVNHQIMDRNRGRKRYLGLLKLVSADKDGTLWLKYWTGNERYKGGQVKPVKCSDCQRSFVRLFENVFDAERGVIFEGDILFEEGQRNGLYIQTGDGHGTAIMMNRHGEIKFGSMKESADGFVPDDIVKREIDFSSKARFKLFLKGSVLELYIDNLLIQCYSLPAAATGKIGVVAESNIQHFKCWTVR